VSEIETSQPAEGRLLPRFVCARRGGICAALALLATAVFFIWFSLKLDLGHVGLPGPGLFPLALGLVLAVLALSLAWGLWQERVEGETVALAHRDVLITTAAMMLVPPAFERLGAYLTLGLFIVVLLIFIGRAPLVRAGLAATAGMIACWYFFQVLLGVQLPRGAF
jgi:hypothetical protein